MSKDRIEISRVITRFLNWGLNLEIDVPGIYAIMVSLFRFAVFFSFNSVFVLSDILFTWIYLEEVTVLEFEDV